MVFLEGQECTKTLWVGDKARGEAWSNYSAHAKVEQSHMAVDRLYSVDSSPSRAAVGGSHVVGRTLHPFLMILLV